MTQKHSRINLNESGPITSVDRREFLSRLTMAAGALSAPAILINNSCRQAQPEEAVAKTVYGQVRGARNDNIIVFKGIPYAGSPAGENRFKPAPKLEQWSGVRDALLYGPQSIQPPDPNWPKEWKPAISDENCLYLNVLDSGNRRRQKPAVMFYSHGGGFATGNGGADVTPQDIMHDGASLARDYDVVVVTHNHRLGIMGYLYLGDLLGEEYAASGAAGMHDIAAALEWVRDNIAEFGGDPGRIMIWGESGGGAKTTTLTAMPRAQGLYHRASIESGATLRLRTPESASETALAVLDSLGLKKDQARELLTVPADKLREVQQNLPRRRTSATTSVTRGLAEGLGFSPMVDGNYIPAHPYDPSAPEMSKDIPLIVGINKDETLFMHRGNAEIAAMDEAGLRERLEPAYKGNVGRILEVYQRSRPETSPAQLYIGITTAQWMWMNAITLAERKLALNAAPVYMYIFAFDRDAPGEPGELTGAAHAAEIPFKFNNVQSGGFSGERPDRIQAARNMSRAWASFARNGDPSHDEIPKWPAYTLERRATMFLDAECKVVNDPYSEERQLWREIG